MPSKDGLPRCVDALLDLLAAASLDTVDNTTLQRELARYTMEMSRSNPELPDTTQAWDKHIDKMVRQLREAVKETPERESPLLSFEDVATTGPSTFRGRTAAAANHNSYNYATTNYNRGGGYGDGHKPEGFIPDVSNGDRHQYLEREFSSTSYPKIGPGYTDSISVVSELTIPTVVPGMHVPEEEDYSRPSPGIGMTLEFSTKPSRSSSKDNARPPSFAMEKNKPKSRNKTAQYSNAQTTSRRAVSELRPPSQRVMNQPTPSPPSSPQPIDAAQRRRQLHQATMAQLGERSGPNASPGTATTFATTRSFASATTAPAKKEMTVNDFPSLNASPNCFSTDDDSAGTNRRRSMLLRKPDNYARAVPTPSSRMLLSNQNLSKSKKATKYGGIRSGRRRSLAENGDTLAADAAAAATSNVQVTESGEKNIDLDGVLSTMGQDIDFIFRELTALEEGGVVPVKKQPNAGFSDSNIGATAKIKNTLGSVEKYLRKDGTIGTTTGNKSSAEFQNMDGWPSTLDAKKDKKDKCDPLLIDEDGFIISADPNDNAFEDPFALQPMEHPKNDFGFETSFFQSSSRDTKPKNSARGKASRRGSTEVGVSVTKKRGSSKGGKSSSKGPDKESRIDAVELATKKKIDMLRQLVAERAGKETRGGSKQVLDNKLDFVETETMKQIARLRDKMGESKRHLEQR